MSTVTINAQDLRRTLRAAALFADDPDDGYPELAAIHLDAGGGIITATATDRYILGHARTQTGGGDMEPGGVGIRVRDAHLIIDALCLAGNDITLESGPVGTPLRVRDRLTVVEVPTVKVPGTCKYRELFGQFNDAQPTTTGQVMLTPRLLKGFAELDDIYPMAASRWTVVEPLKPVRVEVGNDFVALLMPIKTADCRWPVPVGLPEPAAVA